MRFPNLRYGNPTEFAHYAMGIPLKDLARTLRRDERTVRDCPRLGIVRGNVIELATRRPKKEPQVTDLRLDDFDQVQIAL